MLVILPVSITEGTGFYESLGKKLQRNCLAVWAAGNPARCLQAPGASTHLLPRGRADGLPRARSGWVLLSPHLLPILW